MKIHLWKSITAAALLCLLGFLYYKSTSVDADRHMQMTAQLRQLRHLDAQLNQYVLEARYQMLNNYDPLMMTQRHIVAVLNNMQKMRPDLFRTGTPLSDKIDAYIAARGDKNELINAFKSDNSVLRNSVRYFPVATQALLEGKDQLSDGDPMEVLVRDELLHHMLVYQVTPSEADSQIIMNALSGIRQRLNKYRVAQQQQLLALIMHANLMVTYKDSTDLTVVKILNSPTMQLGDEIFNLYSEEFERADREANRYRFWLLLFALMCLGYGGYALVRITWARNQLNQSLKELEFQKFALDQHSIVSITDRSGCITYVNKRFTQISQFSEAELLNQDHRLLNSNYHPHEFFKEMWSVIGHGKVWHGEVRNRKKDGSFYWVDSTIVPLMDARGKPERYISIRTDITVRKEAETAMRQAKEAAEEISRLKSDFLSNMSHEIRTPMNGIIGMTDLALDTPLSDEQREYLGLVKSSANALLGIINDILDFSKIEAGRMDIEIIEFSLEHMLRETMKTLALRAHQKQLELLLHIGTDVPERLLGDPGRIRQVLINLVGNAIKFTEQGEIEVKVEMRGAITAGIAALQFSVRDTGIGIPQEKFKVIFESFSQADTSTTRKYGGTGLGLTISAQLVGLMGGRIWPESVPGKGSTFFFNLDLAVLSSETFATYQSTGLIQSMPVLVVDNNATNRLVLTEMLRSWKMSPHAVHDGMAALAELARSAQAGTPYPLTLLDMRMPGMDGFELVEKIRQHPEYHTTSIMMLTSDGQRGDAARCQELGVASYLSKPIAASELLDAVMTALGTPQAQPAAPLITRHSLRESHRPLTLLLAEDNAVNQTLAIRILEKLGHHVTLAKNGREAVQHWQDSCFDAILMDVDMPEMNGYEATAIIRELESQDGKHIPIIAMTAHAMQGSREECLRAGMDGYISKPIDTAALYQELSTIAGAPHSDTQTETEARSGVIADLQQARERMDNSKELFDEIARLFIQDFPHYLQAAKTALAQGDSEQLRHNAHTLKGMVSIFAAERAMDTAQQIEMQPDVPQCAEWLQQLEVELTALQHLLNAYQWRD